MRQKYTITIQNKLRQEKRDINVYSRACGAAGIIGYGGSSKSELHLSDPEDFLHISPVKGPGNLVHDCMIDIPAWLQFQFSGSSHINLSSTGGKACLSISPGPPDWELKICAPANKSDIPAGKNSDNIVIGDGSSINRQHFKQKK